MVDNSTIISSGGGRKAEESVTTMNNNKEKKMNIVELVKLTSDADDNELEMSLVVKDVEEDFEETEDDDSDEEESDDEEEELDEEEGTLAFVVDDAFLICVVERPIVAVVVLSRILG